jgi:hypothetical protein
VTGVVVAIDEFEKRTILYLDDGSGEGIDIVYDRPPPLPKSADTDPSTSTPPPPTIPDVSLIDVGSVIRAKGTISLFRNTRQICLKRVHILPDTMSEVRVWRGITKFRTEVLMRPWELDEEEVKELSAAAYGEGEGKREGRGRRTKEERQEVEGGGRTEEAMKGKKKMKKKKQENKVRKELFANQASRKDGNRGITGQNSTSSMKEKRQKYRHPSHLDALGL